MTQTSSKQQQRSVTMKQQQQRVNVVSFIGNLGRDAELNYTGNGNAVTKFSLGVNQGKEKPAMWLNIVAWSDLAEWASQLTTGTRVKVVGRLTQRKYQERYYHDVVAEEITLIPRKNQTQETSSPNPTEDTLGDLDEHPF